MSSDMDATEDAAVRWRIARRRRTKGCREEHLLHPQELLHRPDVHPRDGMVLAEVALTLRRLLREVVALHRVPAPKLSRPGQLEPLLCPAPCLHLRHLF